eukprot:jgi/Ulvmu1/9451/UM052_0016.1
MNQSRRFSSAGSSVCLVSDSVRSMRWLAVLGLCAMFAVAVNGFLVPEPSPHVFLEGEVVPIDVNSLTSYEGHLPYEYYSLPFCKPEDGVKAVDTSFNPGNNLSGLQI